MSEFDLTPAVDEFDLTPRASTRPARGDVLFSTPRTLRSDLTSEGFEGGVGVDGAGEYGKPDAERARLSDIMEEMDVSEEDGCDTLFFYTGWFGGIGAAGVCCGVISSGQGIRRFCTLQPLPDVRS